MIEVGERMRRRGFDIGVLSLFIAALGLILTGAPVALAEDVSCECQEATCAPCEIESGTTFYSSKCGPNNSRVKSCKKVTCVPVEEQKQCLADLKPSTGETALATAKPPTSDESAQARAPAATKDLTTPVGTVIFAAGPATLMRVGQTAVAARTGDRVFQEDVLETGEGGRMKVRFLDSVKAEEGSELNVTPNSKTIVEVQQFEAANRTRKTVLNLMYGQIRTKVKQKYDAKDSSFQVKTRAAVAGVRGTDFITTFRPDEDRWVTEVKTFEGSVELAGRDQEKKALVPKGTYAAFVVSGPPKGAFSDEDIHRFIKKGYLTPVDKLSPDEIKKLVNETDYPDELNRDPASAKVIQDDAEAVCQSPKGNYKQCSWTCEGKNPAGDKNCRTELPEVSCVRRICKANGQWTEMMRLPASQGDLCQPDKTVVGACGDYW